MSAPLDFSFVIDQRRERRREQEIALRRQELNPAVGINLSLPTVSGPAPNLIVPGPAIAEQEPALQSLTKVQRAKEFFRLSLRRKRVAEKSGLSQRINSHIKEPVEPPSLSGADPLKLQAIGDEPLHAVPAGIHSDPDTISGGHDNGTTQFLSVEGIQRCHPTPGASSPSEEQSEPDDEDVLFGEQLIAQVSDEAVAAWDSPGNRTSTRPSIFHEGGRTSSEP